MDSPVIIVPNDDEGNVSRKEGLSLKRSFQESDDVSEYHLIKCHNLKNIQNSLKHFTDIL